MRNSLRITSVIVGSTLVLGLSIGPLSAVQSNSSASGNATSLLVERHAIAHFGKITNYKTQKIGQYWFGYNSTGNWYLSADTPKPVYSYQKAVARDEVIVTSNNSIVWDLSTFHQICTTAHPCAHPLTPLRFYATTTTVAWGYVNLTTNKVPCWYAPNGATAWINGYRTGGTNWVIDGTAYQTPEYFGVPIKSGGVDTITATYQYLPSHRNVIETDRIRTSDSTVRSYTMNVAAGQSRSNPAYKYKVNYWYPTTTPHPPTINYC